MSSLDAERAAGPSPSGVLGRRVWLFWDLGGAFLRMHPAQPITLLEGLGAGMYPSSGVARCTGDKPRLALTGCG